MDPLVSIIIPVYNVEKYLDKCITSVVNQTYKNLEIILIDDGSPDNCPAICDAWKSRDSRIKVIHQQNGGLSHARNEGLKIATGEFIGFVDSDDWIEPEMYETLLTAIQENDADIAVCNYQSEHEKAQVVIQKPESPSKKIYTEVEALELLLSGKSFIRSVVWNKLFKSHLLTDLLFPEGKIYEDSLWTPQAIGRSKIIVTIDLVLYHYFFREESLSHDVHNLYNALKDIFDLRKLRVEYIYEDYPCLENLAIAEYQNICCQKYIQVSLKNRQFDIDGSIRQMIHANFCKWSWSKNLKMGSYKEGTRCLVFRFCPRLIPVIHEAHSKLRNIWYKII